MGIIIFLVVGLIALGQFADRRHRRRSAACLPGCSGSADNIIGQIIIATLGAILCILVWQRIK
jgi:hypothetical protein